MNIDKNNNNKKRQKKKNHTTIKYRQTEFKVTSKKSFVMLKLREIEWGSGVDMIKIHLIHVK